MSGGGGPLGGIGRDIVNSVQQNTRIGRAATDLYNDITGGGPAQQAVPRTAQRFQQQPQEFTQEAVEDIEEFGAVAVGGEPSDVDTGVDVDVPSVDAEDRPRPPSIETPQVDEEVDRVEPPSRPGRPDQPDQELPQQIEGTSASAQGINVTANVDGEPGRVEINADVSGKVGISTTQTIEGIIEAGQSVLSSQVAGLSSGDDTVTVSFQLGDTPDISSQIQNNLRMASQLVERIPNQLPGVGPISTTAGNIIPRDLRQINSVSQNLWFGVLGTRLGGDQDPPVITKEFNFQPLRIPVPPGRQLSFERLPGVPVTIRAEPSEIVQNAVGNITGAIPEVTVRIPLEYFVEPIDVTEFPCGELYPSAEQAVSRVEERTVRTLESIAGNVPQDAPGAQQLRNILPGGGGAAGDVRPDGGGVTPRGVIQSALDNSQSIQEALSIAPQAVSGGVGEQIANRMSNAQSQLENVQLTECLQNFQNRLSRVRDLIGTLQRGITAEGVEGACSEAFSGIQGRIEQLSSDFQETSIQTGDIVDEARSNPRAALDTVGEGISDIQSLLDETTQVRQQIQQEVPQDTRCFDSFMSQVESIEAGAQRRIQVEESLAGRLNQAIQQIGAERPRLPERPELPQQPELPGGRPQLGCGDVPVRIRNGVSGAVETANNFNGRAPTSQNKQRAATEVEDINTLISQIENTVSQDNPCRNELLSRARSARNRLQAFISEEATPTPCSQKFPDLGNRIEDFESDVLELDAPVTGDTIQQFGRRADDITTMIEQEVPDEDRCSVEMSQQVQELVGRVRQLRPEVRISLPGEDEQDGEREQFLQTLIERLEQQQQTGEETSNVGIGAGGGLPPGVGGGTSGPFQ